MTLSLRTLLVGESALSRSLIERFLEESDLLLDAVVSHDEVIAQVALRAPDLIVIDVDSDTPELIRTCGVLKANPATVFLPLLGLGRSGKLRVAAFSAGVDDFLTHQVRRQEFLVRAHALLRAAATRRQRSAEQLAEEVSRREEIRAAFRRYISPKLADRILADASLRDAMFSTTNSRAHAAVMFADMRGFTGISEQLQPAQVVELLNQFFSLLTEITFHFDGTVFNMAGDGLMVGFGVPIEQSDGVQRAVSAAQAMIERFGAMAEEWRVRYQVETGLGIGINVGEVIAGNIGSPAYMNYTIIGDTVNIASRLGQRARAGEMLFSDAVKRSLDAEGVCLDALSLPSLVLRGRTSPIDIFCVPSGQRLDFRPN